MPDGGTLVNLVVPEAELAAKRVEASSLPTLTITSLDKEWLHVLADGWASPLRGFMSEAQYLQCLHFGHVVAPDGSLASQSIPIVLALTEQDKTRLVGDNAITLIFDGKPIAIMRKPEFFEHRQEERAGRTWGFTTPGIPYIDLINDMGPWLVGGELEVLGPVMYNDGLDEYRKSPAVLRAEFERRGADAVFAFQLRNPVHNGHALLMTTTRENLIKEGYKNPVLLLHPLGGWTKADDVPLNIRMQQHFAVIKERALDPDSTVLAIWPSPMSYSGPNEVLWHAKSRIAAGVTHYIVGRDPAGMKHPVTKEDLYESSHGRKVLEMCPGMKNKMVTHTREFIIVFHTVFYTASMQQTNRGFFQTFVGFKPAAYDKTTQKMAFIDPTRKSDFVSISGSKMRKYVSSSGGP